MGDTNRPCECGNARVGDLTPDQCWDCWRWVNSPGWRAIWTTGRRPAPPAAPAPCAHLGDQITGHEREALGLDHRRDWRWCGLGLTLGTYPAGVACRCAGCGPACAGYAPGDG